jgi:hypothetical protein
MFGSFSYFDLKYSEIEQRYLTSPIDSLQAAVILELATLMPIDKKLSLLAVPRLLDTISCFKEWPYSIILVKKWKISSTFPMYFSHALWPTCVFFTCCKQRPWLPFLVIVLTRFPLKSSRHTGRVI